MGPRAGLEERRNILPLPGLKLRPLSCPVRSRPLSWLPPYFGKGGVEWNRVHYY
jgi:hypothetical protein